MSCQIIISNKLILFIFSFTIGGKGITLILNPKVKGWFK